MIRLENEILKNKYLDYAVSLTKDMEEGKEVVSQMISLVYEKKELFEKALQGGYIEGYIISTIYRLFIATTRAQRHEELPEQIADTGAIETTDITPYQERIATDLTKKKRCSNRCYLPFAYMSTTASQLSWRATATLTAARFNMQLSNIN
jgi:DNA-directed RNA polymerase specialized sigma24 family protein